MKRISRSFLELALILALAAFSPGIAGAEDADPQGDKRRSPPPDPLPIPITVCIFTTCFNPPFLLAYSGGQIQRVSLTP